MKWLLVLLCFVFTLSGKPHYRNLTVDTLILTCDTVTSADYVLVKSPDDTIRCMHVDSVSGSSGGDFNGTIEDLHVPYYVETYDSFTTAPIIVNGSNVGVGASYSDSLFTVVGSSYLQGNTRTGGKLGINTNTIDSFLTVSGSGKVSGNCYFGSRVGIGKYDPDEELHIDGIDARVKITDISNGSSQSLFGLSYSNGGFMGLYDDAGANNVMVRSYGNTFFTGGNVGIGTAYPGAKLDVAGTADVDTLRVPCGVTTSPTYVLCKTAAAGDTVRQIDIDELTDLIITESDFNGTIDDMYVPYYIEAYDSFATSPIINYNGKIGINDATPDSLFSVGGSVDISGNSYFGGRVGIGTNTPTQKLHIDGGNILIDNNREVRQKDYSGTERTVLTLNTSNELNIGTSTGDLVIIAGNGSYTERMRVKNNGKVGINTTSPDSLLTVNGSGDISGNCYLGGNVGVRINDPDATLDVCSGVIGLMVGANSAAYTRSNGVDKYSRIAFPHYSISEEPIGIVYGLSTSTENRVQIGGGTSLCNAATLVRFYTAANTATVTGTERMRINSSGDVGINDASPDSLLSVGGSVDVADNCYVGWRLGIGKNNPEERLHIDGSNARMTITNSTIESSKLLMGVTNGSGGYVGLYDNSGSSKVSLNANSDSYLNGGDIGIGISSPEATLDICYGGKGLMVGADNGAGTRTTYTDKYSRIIYPHYIATEEPVAHIYGYSTSSENRIHIGGGTSLCNAATTLRFYTGANTTTNTGTVRMTIDSDGDVGIGTSSPGSNLDVVGTAEIDTLKVTCAVTTNPNYILCKSSATADTVRQITLAELTNIILAENEVITDIRNASTTPIENAVSVVLIIFFLFQQVQINKLDERIKTLEKESK